MRLFVLTGQLGGPYRDVVLVHPKKNKGVGAALRYLLLASLCFGCGSSSSVPPSSDPVDHEIFLDFEQALASAEAGKQFVHVNLPEELDAFGGSVGDVNGDGFVDAVLATPTAAGTTEIVILYNEDGRGFYSTTITDESLLSAITSVRLIDADNNTLTDILVGGRSGAIQVIYQDVSNEFVVTPATLLTPEAPTYVIPIIALPNGQYLAGQYDLEYPPTMGRGDEFLDPAPNFVFSLDREEGVASLPVPTHLQSCWERQTFGAVFAPRQTTNEAPLIGFVNDFAPDCFAAIDDDGSYLPLVGGFNDMRRSSMGVDFRMTAQSVIFGVPHGEPELLHLLEVRKDDDTMYALPQHRLRPNVVDHVPWELLFRDFTGDGVEDLMIASARLDKTSNEAFQPPDGDEVRARGGIIFYQGVGINYHQTAELMPPIAYRCGDGDEHCQMECTQDPCELDPGYFNILSGDFNNDGCMDVLGTPHLFLLSDTDRDVLSFMGRTAFLFNTCEGHSSFVGVNIPQQLSHVGTIGRLTTTDGDRYLRAVKMFTGTSGGNDPRLLFSLPAGTVPERLELFLTSGEIFVLDNPESGAYLELDEFRTE